MAPIIASTATIQLPFHIHRFSHIVSRRPAFSELALLLFTGCTTISNDCFEFSICLDTRDIDASPLRIIFRGAFYVEAMHLFCHICQPHYFGLQARLYFRFWAIFALIFSAIDFASRVYEYSLPYCLPGMFPISRDSFIAANTPGAILLLARRDFDADISLFCCLFGRSLIFSDGCRFSYFERRKEKSGVNTVMGPPHE